MDYPHLYNAVFPLIPHVPYHMVFLMFGLLRRHRWVVESARTRQRGPHASHRATWIHGGVVTNVCGRKGLAGQVCDPVT